VGYSSWSASAYRSVTSTRTARPASEVFRGEKSIDPLMDPRKLTFREARDSEHHPHSVPIIVAFDVTGSMGHVPKLFATELLGKLMRMLVEGGYVSDPQLLFAAVGDAVSDRAPLQVGQFESGLEMDMWLTKIWLEGGGGDAPESYPLVDWFAAYHTKTDHFERRGEKGYLFIIGDETDKDLESSHIQRVFGYSPDKSVRSEDVLDACNERWHRFRVMLGKDRPQKIPAREKALSEVLRNRTFPLFKPEAICEFIAATLGVLEGNMTTKKAEEILTDSGCHSDIASLCSDALGGLATNQ